MTASRMADRVTLSRIAQLSGVSISTASRVLNGAPGISDRRRAEVLAVAERLGWHDDLGAVTLAVLSPIDPQAADAPDFHQELLAGIAECCADLGIRHQIRLVPPGGAVALPAVQGLIVLSLDDDALIRAVLAAGMPAVMVNGVDPAARLPASLGANRADGFAAADHLIQLGHRRILRLTHPGRLPVRDRFLGADLAMERAGIAPDPGLDLPLAQMRSADAYDAVGRWLACTPRDGATAIQCCNDAAALGAMAAVMQAGLRVPGDLSVIGVDDIPAAAHAPCPLTTIRVPRARIGAEGVRLLLRRIRDRSEPVTLSEIAGRLIVRASTGPAARTG